MMKSGPSGPFLLFLLCTPAVSELGSVLKSEYQYHRHLHYTWQDAQGYCRSEYNRDLAVMYSQQDTDGLEIKDYYAWIGLFGESWSHCSYVSSTANSSVYGAWCGVYYFFICQRAHNDHYHYKFVAQSKTWSEAQSYCKDVFTDLATYERGLDLREANPPQVFPVWTGLHREEGAWRWSRGLSEYRDWSDNGETGNDADCVSISSESKEMSARNCASRYPFICYWDNLVLVKENKTWEGALEHCRALRGGGSNHDLVSVQPGQEYGHIMRRLVEADTEQVWTGLRFLAGDWLWVNGAVLLYSDLPSCPLEQQQCGSLSKRDTGSMEISNCSETRNFLCYSF